MNFVQVVNAEDNKEFRQFIIDSLPHRLFELVLYRGEKLEELSTFPIQNNTCKLFRNTSAVGIGFDKRGFLLQCVGKNRIQSLNNAKGKVEDTLKKIEDVLGPVEAINELRGDVQKLMQAISKVFDYDNEELNQK